MTGTLALVGGAEFRKPCEEMDRELVRLAGGPGARVGIVPAAAARENPGLAAENGVRHFRRLDARAEAVMIVDPADAQIGRIADAIEELALVYLTGGDPVHLLETLRGSAAWRAMLRLLERGGVLAGSSAGAMVLGGRSWAPGEGWREGLGAAPGIAIVPHHATLAARWNVKEMRRGLPAEAAIVGLDECTGLIGSGEWRVLGAGEVTVYRREATDVFRAGEAIRLERPAGL